MPYIRQEDRAKIDPLIPGLKQLVSQMGFGALNYAITQLCLGMKTNKYEDHAALSGVLDNVKDELYRRRIAMYEDRKIQENGDIPGYGYGV